MLNPNEEESLMATDKYWKGRGSPWEYDAGPPTDTDWAKIFSATPNYRQLSKVVIGKERHRWQFGPMYYRGRLAKHSVKVVVIGQEGAQDESLAHRSFVGGTGSRMQHFLNFIGINHSYVFLNTFVYPITGQYDSKLKWLAQNTDSPIVQHRHKILDYLLDINDVRLVIAVGVAAKESVKTWVESKGGTCPDGISDLSTCTGSFLDPHTKVVGVLHPGGAGQGGSTTAIKKSFQKAADKISTWLDEDPTWLPLDSGAVRDLTKPYTYRSIPIPFCDLPFGITWRIGRGGTSSNRKDAQRSIQVFSAAGKYGNKGHTLSYTDLALGTPEGYSEGPDDVPYEPPVSNCLEYDGGPDVNFAKIAMGGVSGLEWPDFTALGVKAHESLGYGPLFRGRPAEATFLILADQESHDDLFTCRALTGDAGQRLQSFMHALGITRSYCILRSLPVDTLDLDEPKRLSIASDPQMVNIYKALVQEVLSKNKTKLILTVGSVAGNLIDILVSTTIPVIKLKSWNAPGAKQDWQGKLETIKTKSYHRDIQNPTYAFSGTLLQIPRFDLPYGTLRWQGSSGDRARRAKRGGKWSGDYYKLLMPDWAFKLAPLPLSVEEQNAVNKAP
jgi:uracil-DNA glycosylase